MSHVDWCGLLNWGQEQLDGLAYAGWSYVRQGRYEEARKIYEALAALDPKRGDYFEMLGAIELQVGDYQKAIERLDHALHLDPGHEPSLVNKSKALLLLGYREEGLKLARSLVGSEVQVITDRASALVMAYE